MYGVTKGTGYAHFIGASCFTFSYLLQLSSRPSNFVLHVLLCMGVELCHCYIALVSVSKVLEIKLQWIYYR